MHLFSGLMVWALPLAALVSFIFGAVWYGVLSGPWRAAAGLPETTNSSPPPHVLALTFLAELVMAVSFAGVLLHLHQAGIAATPKNGVVSALFLWVGFVAMPMLVNHLYQGANRRLTLIDGAHWLGVMVVQGAILGAFAIK